MLSRAELHRLQTEYWHLVAHRCHVPSPGDFLKLEWLGEELVIFNDHGELLLFDNVCPHRGARFFDKAEGNQRLLCPYHGWSFGRGKLQVPFAHQLPAGALEQVRFRTLQQAWCGDFLFAGFAPRTSLAEQLGGIASVLEEISKTIAAPHSTNAFTWNSDWRIALENALEQYHTQVGLVHVESFSKHKMSEGADQFFGKNALFRCEYLDPGTVKKLKGLRRFFDLPQQFEGYQILHLFPFSTLASTFGYSYALQTFLPSDQPHRTHFTSRLMTSRLKDGMKPEVLASFFDSTAQMNKTVFDEDHAICQRVSPRALSPDFGPLLGLHEAKVSHFRQALKEALQHP